MGLIKQTITAIDSGAREIIFNNFDSQHINKIEK